MGGWKKKMGEGAGGYGLVVKLYLEREVTIRRGTILPKNPETSCTRIFHNTALDCEVALSNTVTSGSLHPECFTTPDIILQLSECAVSEAPVSNPSLRPSRTVRIAPFPSLAADTPDPSSILCNNLFL